MCNEKTLDCFAPLAMITFFFAFYAFFAVKNSGRLRYAYLNLRTDT